MVTGRWGKECYHCCWRKNTLHLLLREAEIRSRCSVLYYWLLLLLIISMIFELSVCVSSIYATLFCWSKLLRISSTDMVDHGPGLSTSQCSQWQCSHQRPPRLTSTSTLYPVLSFRAQFLIASQSYPYSCVALAVKVQHVWSCLRVKNPPVATRASAPFSLVRVKLCKICAGVAGPLGH